MTASQDSAKKVLINLQLGEHFGRNRENDFDSIAVLLLYWKDCDPPGFKDEASRLEGFFGDSLHYPVIRYEIPSDKSDFALARELTDFLQTLSAPRSLAIIHYGGHGDRDFGSTSPNSRRSVWAAKGSGGPTLNWSNIQPMLANMAGKILLLLDCCYGAQAARTTGRVIPGNVELHAACAMGCESAPPGDSSFTMAWIREAKTSLSEKGFIRVSEIHHGLARGDRHLPQTPNYFPLQGEPGSIRLDPFSPTSAAVRFPRSQEARMALEMIIRAPLDEETIDNIISWLKTNAPRRVSSLVVTDLTDAASHIRDFVLEKPTRAHSITSFVSLPEAAKTEIWQAWSGFSNRLASMFKIITSQLPSRSNAPASYREDEVRIEEFVRSFEKNIATLQRVVERNVLTSPGLLEKDLLVKAISDPSSKDLGLVEALTVRFLACFPSPDRRSLEKLPNSELKSTLPSAVNQVVQENHGVYGSVLVEYKYYEKLDPQVLEASKDLINRLACVLKASTPKSYHTPECVEWFSDQKKSRFGLVFRNDYRGKCSPITLRQILEAHNSTSKTTVPKPTLEERFTIARTIGQALLKWHTAGWLHQGIASHNIVFFKDPVHQSIDYSQPYLFGFDFSRELNDLSRDKHLYNPTFDMYRHPDRQGRPPPKQHCKEHDIYSFGLLLFEIAVWDLIPLQFSGLLRREGPAALAKEVSTRSRELVGHIMGKAYEQATSLCLSGNFNITRDEKLQPKLARAFEHRVLHSLEVGVGLDGDAVY